ncbi:MAG: hypothetical protein JRJ65_03050 [Deltaproteobacteria bacterium]|nr:hypothetical protein [Deltaproteobacteria bacterium]
MALFPLKINLGTELESMVGREIMNKHNIVNHYCRKPGKNRQGVAGNPLAKGIPLVLLALTIFISRGIEARASWFIDAGKYHISAHGQTSCQDCHEGVADRALHPNPSDVNKKQSDFFNKDQCLLCHDEILENLDQGLHGSKRVQASDNYGNCLRCHRPHYQPRLGENRMGIFDPSKPRHEQCGACHKGRSSLPDLSRDDDACMTCHRLSDPHGHQSQEKIARLCFQCHGQEGTKAQKMTEKVVPLIDGRAYRQSPHARIVCTLCHPNAASFRHGSQKPGDCGQCHLPHDEKVAHEAHMGVACEACHLKGVKPVRNPESKHVLWERKHIMGEASEIHQMVRGEWNAACLRCHFKGNRVGAVSMILPAKGILCMPCHAATFSVGDTTTVLALIVFLAGMVMIFSYVLSGSMAGESDAGPIRKLFKLSWIGVRTILSWKIFFIVKTMILDVLLQRRLYRQSKRRWLIHSLIFFPFVFRFLWGFIALCGSLWKPDWSPVWAMLDKNHPATAFLFDLTGSMVILGVILALIRGTLRRSGQMPGLPGQDFLALGLVAGIVMIGFVIEGMRIAMTAWPLGAEYAFVGYGISMLFSEPGGLTDIYGYVWYIHAILTGAFVAYLHFSRLSHIILAPVVLTMNAASEHKQEMR